MSTATHAAGCRSRYFSLMDTEKIARPHAEYARAVQSYFHGLFPQWQVFHDPVGTPLAVDVELLYPTVEEPFYFLHTIGMSAAPMHYPAGEFTAGKEGYSELCLILPSDWPFRREREISLDDKEAWPIWLLMELGRFPSGCRTASSCPMQRTANPLRPIRSFPVWSSFSSKVSWAA